MGGATVTSCCVTLAPERMRATHVIGGLAPAEGGPSYSVPRLCAAMAERTEIALLSVAAKGERASDRRHDGYRDRRFGQDFARVPGLRKLRLSNDLRVALGSEARAGGAIHSHGLWLGAGLYAARAAHAAASPLIVSPRGMLSPVALSFSRIRKRVFWSLFQRRALAGAACLHATSDAECRDIRALGLTNPVAVIPNGIDLPQEGPRAMAPERTVLSLGRLHRKKGLSHLVRAWAGVERTFPEWRLRIAGPAEGGHDRELLSLVAELGLGRVSIEGPIYGDAKWAAYRDADVFVLPSLDENFGLTAAEALAAGTPVISSKGAPWAGLEREGCGWWVDPGEVSLTGALRTAIQLPREQLLSMGARGRAWMERDFAWEAIAAEMLAVYDWLARGGPSPPTVRLSSSIIGAKPAS